MRAKLLLQVEDREPVEVCEFEPKAAEVVTVGDGPPRQLYRWRRNPEHPTPLEALVCMSLTVEVHAWAVEDPETCYLVTGHSGHDLLAVGDKCSACGYIAPEPPEPDPEEIAGRKHREAEAEAEALRLRQGR